MFITLLAVALFWSGLAAWSYSRRSGLPLLNFYGLLRFFLVLCGKVSDSLLLSALICGIMARMLYHTLQSTNAMSVVSRNDQEEFVIKVFLITAFVLKVCINIKCASLFTGIISMQYIDQIVEVMHILHHQLTVDIFLIDWEKPRAMNCLPRPVTTALGSNQVTSEDMM